jgi:D-3-phosphoglycerate dehydrogenase / 2-oxoglutarate reductase
MKILFASKTHDFLKNKLKKAGHKCEVKILKNSDELAPIISQYDGIIINSRFVIDKAIIDKAVRLKFVARVGAGMENIDVDYLKQNGIRCINSPEGNRRAVGEHTLGMMLALLRNIGTSNFQIRNGKWLRLENKGRELSKLNVGIIGYGNMGMAFAKCVDEFVLGVYAYDKYRENYFDDYAEEFGLDYIFDEADIVSIHVPLTEETHYMVNDKFINSFKKNIYLLNTSRGKVVNTADLVKNLKSGKVLGAGLDVLEYESPSFDSLDVKDYPEPLQYLIKAPNVILTPHIAGLTKEADLKHAKTIEKKIRIAFADVILNSDTDPDLNSESD